jgi:hypothetical protein
MRNEFAIVNNNAAYTPAVDAEGNVLLSPDYSVPSSFLKDAKTLFIAPAVGVAGTLAVTFAGTGFSIGDTVRLNIESNLTSRQKFVKSYVVEITSVLSTVTLIAAEFVKKFNREINAGLLDYPIASATSALGVLTITQKGDDKAGLIATTYTDSAGGTIVSVPTPTVLSEGQPSDLVDKGIASADIVLGSFDTVKIELNIEAAIPFIDSKGTIVKELFQYVSPGKGTLVVALINGL